MSLSQALNQFAQNLGRYQSLDLTPAILLSFDFSNLPSKRQDEHDCAAFFCDWTIEYEIREHQKRMPTSMEKN